MLGEGELAAGSGETLFDRERVHPWDSQVLGRRGRTEVNARMSRPSGHNPTRDQGFGSVRRGRKDSELWSLRFQTAAPSERLTT